MGYKGSQGAVVTINGKAIFSHKMHFLINYHTEALYSIEVKINILLRLFSAVKPLQNNLMLLYKKKVLSCLHRKKPIKITLVSSRIGWILI